MSLVFIVRKACSTCLRSLSGLAGRGGGRMVGAAEPLLIVPSDDTARIQEMHITLGHMLCGALEEELCTS